MMCVFLEINLDPLSLYLFFEQANNDNIAHLHVARARPEYLEQCARVCRCRAKCRIRWTVNYCSPNRPYERPDEEKQVYKVNTAKL